MAAVTTPEHVEAHTAPVAEKPSRVEVRKVAIDNNLLSVLAVGVALFALAFGAFTHLSGRMDGLDAKLSGRMDGLDAKMDKIAAEQRAEVKELNAKVDKVSTELNAKIDKVSTELNVKIDKVSTELNGKLDSMNARLDRLFELVASQGRERPSQ